MTKYTVTRQTQWPDGDRVVEVSVGSFDYCNPGDLCPRYEGEGDEYELATEAVNAALSIQTQWQKDCPEEVGIAYGNTHGMEMPFSPCDREDLLTWAKDRDDALPNCDQCGKKIADKTWNPADYPDFEFCSEFCVSEWLAEQSQEDDEDE